MMRAQQRRLRQLADAPMPPGSTLLELTAGLAITHVVAAVAELDIAGIVGDRTMSTAEIARRAGTDPDTTHRLLRTAAAFGLCTMNRRTGKVRMTRVGKTLHRDHPASMHDWAVYMGLRSTADAWTDLVTSVRTGEPAFPRVHGVSVWEWFSQHPDEEQLFAGSMRAIAVMNAQVIAKTYPWPHSGTVCDVGGGIGTLLATVLDAHPYLRGILVDAPGPVAEAETFLASRNLTSRVTRTVGNLFESLDVVADIYLLKDVLHDWDDARCATILEHVAATMPSGSRLVLVEIVQHPNTANFLAPFVDLQMLTQTDGGRQRTVEQLNALLTTAGLTPTGTVLPAYAHSLVEARK
ncbi:Aclacinomycin 10-hydroxylase RdmB [Rhodococcus sp. T7]|nr:Aclacinomycin 10-hydroxylase RdmB [Rhodococcus sp. T7]KAF0965123.1 Aclacinomycin 10-hydroxylase RdmB [Rhodococcus sp. T7]